MWPLFSEDNVGGQCPKAQPPSGMSINVSGQVKRPGKIQLGNGATVLDALAAAGGPNEWTNLSKARILRETAQGEKAIVVNLREMLTGKTAPTPLQEGDRLILYKIPIPF